MVFQIDVYRIPVHPTECDPRVSAGVDREAAFVATGEPMKTETRVLWPRRVIERAQNVGNPPRILHAETTPVSGREEAFKGLVSERPDHTAT
jgi:hypothetical protein